MKDRAAGRAERTPPGVLVPPPRGRGGERGRRLPGFARALLAAFAVLALAGGAWLWLRSGSDPAATGTGSGAAGSSSAPDPAPTAEPPAELAPAPLAAADSARELPDLDGSDALVRDLVAGLSSRPAWASWLVPDDLVRRFVASVVSVSAGASPREHVPHLAPEGRFRVRRSGGRAVLDPAGYERYDPAAATVASLDTGGTARLYRRLHPLFEEAHRELGFPEGTFDEALARAIRTLTAVEVPETPPELVREEGVYVFRDPALESRSAAEKHLLRMGPENARLVQAKLRELARAIGLPDVGPETGPAP